MFSHKKLENRPIFLCFTLASFSVKNAFLLNTQKKKTIVHRFWIKTALGKG